MMIIIINYQLNNAGIKQNFCVKVNVNGNDR